MGCTRIYANNLLSLASNLEVSSEQAAFPDDNLYNFQRRSKVWRSNGYWNIDSTNKTIIFRETTAVDLTAEVAEDIYNSDDDFFTAVKAAFEVNGSSTYTLSRDANTHRIIITSDGAGGGGIFELDWDHASSAGFAGITGFDTSAEDTGQLTYTADTLKIATEEFIQWDFGLSTNPAAFIAIGSRNSPIKLTPSATFKLEGNETDVWTSPSYSETLTYDDRSISKFESTEGSGLHTEPLRYWRIKFEDTSNANGYIELGSVYLGDIFRPSRGAVQIPFSGNYLDRSRTIFSEGGQTFSDIRPKSESFSLEWRGLTVAEKEEFDTIFDDQGTSTPFFISLDPDANISSVGNYFLRYVKFQSPPSYRLISPGNYGMTMRLREEL